MKTSERLERIEARLTAIESHLPRLINRDEMNARFDEVPTRSEMNDGLAEGRRHTGVLFEEAQSRMELLEEGLSARIDREGAETRALVTSSHAELKSLITSGYRDLDRRATRLEERRR